MATIDELVVKRHDLFLLEKIGDSVIVTQNEPSSGYFTYICVGEISDKYNQVYERSYHTKEEAKIGHIETVEKFNSNPDQFRKRIKCLIE